MVFVEVSFLGSYEERTKRSKELYERANRVLPAGVSYGIRAFPPYPFYVDHAEGARLYDIDGNVYADYWGGHGALILGHSPKPVIEAVMRQLPRGTHFGLSHELEVELAERITEMVPCAEMLRYTTSGTEANMYGTRLARAYTGRMKMLKIEGGWHGGYDSLHKAVTYPFTRPESAGLDPKTIQDTLAVPFNDLEEARRGAKGRDLACIILEPVMGAAGFITPEPGYLEGLREICDETDTLLVFDEVVTGFRLAPGGAQEYYDVKPDISIIGKIMGGGFPIGAFCGRRDIFELLDQRKYTAPETRAAHGGTFAGNAISMAAGIATLDALRDGRVYSHIDALGERIREGLADIAERSRLPASITGVGSTFAIHFQSESPRNVGDTARNDLKTTHTYFNHMLERGIVYLSPTVCHCWVSSPHTREDAEEYLAASEDFFRNHRS
jgi:glutamate-1-semialdehyde 2,1-aminomutase